MLRCIQKNNVLFSLYVYIDLVHDSNNIYHAMYYKSIKVKYILSIVINERDTVLRILLLMPDNHY